MTEYFVKPIHGNPMQTYSGHIIDLTPPWEFPIYLEDIVWPLSRMVRYNGQTGVHPRAGYSVLSHSMFVSDLVEERLKAYALLHDAHEAYLGDIIQPVKNLLFNQMGIGSYTFKKEVEALDEKIFAAFGLDPLGATERELLHDADILALHYERKHFFPSWKETKQKRTGFTEHECWPNIKKKKGGYLPDRRPLVPYVDGPANALVAEFCARLKFYTPVKELPLADPEGEIRGEKKEAKNHKDTGASRPVDKLDAA